MEVRSAEMMRQMGNLFRRSMKGCLSLRTVYKVHFLLVRRRIVVSLSCRHLALCTYTARGHYCARAPDRLRRGSQLCNFWEKYWLYLVRGERFSFRNCICRRS